LKHQEDSGLQFWATAPSPTVCGALLNGAPYEA